MSHVVVNKQETRRLREVVEIVNVNNDGTALINTPMKWDPISDKFFFKKQSKIFEKISAKNGISLEKLQKEFDTRTKLIYELYKRKIFEFNEVGKIVNEYYKNPIEILSRFKIQE